MAYQEINFGVPFTVSMPNTREKEFKVLNFHEREFDFLVATIKNTTSYHPPKAFVVDAENGVIKLQFDSLIPLTTSLEIVIQAAVSTKEEVVNKTVLLDGEKAAEAVKTGVSNFWNAVKWAILSFVGMAVFFWFIQGTVFGNWLIDLWSRFNAAQVIKISSEFDPQIATNKHDVYKSAAFTEYNALYKRNFGFKNDLSKLYNFVGNGLFITKDLIKNHDSSFMLLNKPDAENYCEMLAGRLLSTEELKAYLAGQYLDIENFLWPVKLRANVPEWSGTKESWDNYFVYIKNAANPIKNESVKDNFVVADEDDHQLAFRCGFTENIFLPAK